MKIELQKWTGENKEDLIRICNAVNRDFLADRLPYPYTKNDADWWIDMVEKNDGKNGVFRAIVADGTVVGNISVEKKDGISCLDSEIGYMLLTSWWSKGVMTEAVHQICEAAFHQLEILRISAVVYAPNTASRRVLEKNGFELEGIAKKSVCKDGHIYDKCRYGILKEDFENFTKQGNI